MAVAKSGVRTIAGFEHRDQIVRDEEGKVISSRLVCQHLVIEFPELPPLPVAPASASEICFKAFKRKLDNWLSDYKKQLDFFEFLCLYDKARMNYVYKHRHEDILEKYRTGAAPPTTVGDTLREIAKLKIKR